MRGFVRGMKIKEEKDNLVAVLTVESVDIDAALKMLKGKGVLMQASQLELPPPKGKNP
ncbi:MAG: hypothetical protein ACE5JJ_12455 [Nitrospinota bacterium]